MANTGTRTQRIFNPRADEEISLLGERYRFMRHPSAQFMAYAAEGKRGTVYQVRSRSGVLYALKVFKSNFRNPALASQSRLGDTLQNLPGLRASNRRVITPNDPAVRDYAELQYAILMPWIAGYTWSDLLLLAEQSGMWLDTHEAVRICMDFTKVLAALEQNGIAHTDVAPANVMIDRASCKVDLLDLEDLYFPGAPPPAFVNGGVEGYRPRSVAAGETLWTPTADRYAGAILAAEILVLSHSDLAKQATAEGFFLSTEGSEPGDARYVMAKGYLKFFFPAFTAAFEKAWRAHSLADCPTLSDLSRAIAADAQILQVITLPIKVTLNGAFTLEPVDSPKHVPPQQPRPQPPHTTESSGYGLLIAAVFIILTILFLLIIANRK